LFIFPGLTALEQQQYQSMIDSVMPQSSAAAAAISSFTQYVLPVQPPTMVVTTTTTTTFVPGESAMVMPLLEQNGPVGSLFN
jgi:hypothetical protein